MNIFNRAVLIQEPNPEAAAKVWSALRAAGIPYDVKTKGSSGTSAMVRFTQGGRTGSMAGNTFYVIYVKKADLERAKDICKSI